MALGLLLFLPPSSPPPSIPYFSQQFCCFAALISARDMPFPAAFRWIILAADVHRLLIISLAALFYARLRQEEDVAMHALVITHYILPRSLRVRYR